MKRTPVKKRRTTPRRGRIRNPEYLAWIGSLPCVVCWEGLWSVNLNRMFEDVKAGWVPGLPYQESPTEAAHTGPHGISQKANDDTAIPLCAEHHRLGKDALDVLGKRFWGVHGIDRDSLLSELRKRFSEKED